MSSSDLEDDLITYGTALEPLEEDEIPCKKPRLLEDQVVKDKYGRRRFHGAFTGGFSAGFFNTVGSLEGWTPTEFKSSKSKKQEHFQQKPEDFMDEEDLSEFGIAPLILKAKQDYTNEKTKSFGDCLRSQALGNYVLEDLLRPVRETMGIKLLKKMGWKPGQGVGPRLSKTKKKDLLRIQQKTYGCQLPPGVLAEKGDGDSSSGSDWDEIEFAPDDYEPILCEARNNFYGLGYQGLDKRLILSASPSKNKSYNAVEKNKKMAFGSQAFGVGAFEEEDEDIYARDDMSRYDFALGNDANKSPDKKLVTVDGVIEGFMFERTKHVRKKYLLPILPKDFKPAHKCRTSRFDVPPPDKKTAVRSEHNFESRKKLIGNWSEEMEERKRRSEVLVKELISDVKINTNNTFKPFSSNPEKQQRYENYLKLNKIGKADYLSDIQPLSMTSWDKEREKAEFEKAASLFKPLSGEMGDRFLTASQPDDLSDPLAVVEKFHDDRDDARKAARMNMFGPLTRKTQDWTPGQLLCKRFNIPQPTNSVSEQSAEKKSGKRNFDLFAAAAEGPKGRAEDTENQADIGESPKERTKEPESKTEEPHDLNLNDIPDKADLFRAIFLASDDEEEEEEEEGGGGEREERGKLSEDKLPNDVVGTDNFHGIFFEEKLMNTKRNLSPPKGIFENIDFDLLSSAKKSTADLQPEKSEKRRSEPAEAADENSSSLVYGPKIPEKPLVKIASLTTADKPRDDEVWVEKRALSKKHKKKEKKSKKTSHKLKHKHKKHKR